MGWGGGGHPLNGHLSGWASSLLSWFPHRELPDPGILFAQIWDRSQYFANLTPLSTPDRNQPALPSSQRPAERATIRDVALRAGVSKSTVSRYLQGRITDSTRDAIAQAIRELDYRPNTAARNLTRNRSGAIGVLGNDIRQPWHGEFLAGLASVLDRHGYFMLVGDMRVEQRLHERLVKAFAEGQVDGLVLAGTMHVTPALARAMRCIPTVVAGNHEFDLSDLDVVVPDDHAAATLVMDHLLGLGHRRIAHISGPGTGTFPIRRRVYEQRMSSHGLAEHIMVESCDTTDDGGFAATDRLLDGTGPRPTALFVGNDLAALGALALARSRRMAIPGELAIATIDDTFLARSPAISLTSVTLGTERQGSLAGELMIRRIREPGAERAKLVMPPAGISIRNSTAS